MFNINSDLPLANIVSLSFVSDADCALAVFSLRPSIGKTYNN